MRRRNGRDGGARIDAEAGSVHAVEGDGRGVVEIGATDDDRPAAVRGAGDGGEPGDGGRAVDESAGHVDRVYGHEGARGRARRTGDLHSVQPGRQITGGPDVNLVLA